jgi:hypothetical protein
MLTALERRIKCNKISESADDWKMAASLLRSFSRNVKGISQVAIVR